MKAHVIGSRYHKEDVDVGVFDGVTKAERQVPAQKNGIFMYRMLMCRCCGWPWHCDGLVDVDELDVRWRHDHEDH